MQCSAQRRLAMQICEQLPEDRGDALATLEAARFLIENWLMPHQDDPSENVLVFPPRLRDTG